MLVFLVCATQSDPDPFTGLAKNIVFHTEFVNLFCIEYVSVRSMRGEGRAEKYRAVK